MMLDQTSILISKLLWEIGIPIHHFTPLHSSPMAIGLMSDGHRSHTQMPILLPSDGYSSRARWPSDGGTHIVLFLHHWTILLFSHIIGT